MRITTRIANRKDLGRLGEIATQAYIVKTRVSLGADLDKTAAIFAGFFEIGLFPLNHTIVAEINREIVGFATLKFTQEKVPLRTFFRLFQTHLGFFAAIRGLLIIPWLTGGTFDDKTQMFMEFLAVHPEHQNSGIGTRLLEETYRYGVASGKKEACGYVVCQNKAKELYQRIGIIIEPPTYRLWWVSNPLYKFSGYHRLIWPLNPANAGQEGTRPRPGGQEAPGGHRPRHMRALPS